MKDNKNRTLRTALVAVLTMLCTPMYADKVPVKYLDENG